MKEDSGYLGEKVKAIEVSPEKPISKLLEEMAETGFQGKNLGRVADVFCKMVEAEDLTIFFGYAGSLSTTGQWKIINWFIENRYIDVLIPTGANISEDIVEAMGFSYWQGTPNEDDAKLFSEGINRYYDVYGTEPDYLEMTELLAEFIMTLDKSRTYSSREFLKKCGQWLDRKNINSIIAAAARNEVPVFCPAIADSPYGDAALIAESKGHHLAIDAIQDYVEFMGMGESVIDTGVVYIGGGVPKDFIQLFAVTGDLLYEDRKIPGRATGLNRKGTGEQETYYPHKYAIQITTDSPQWGRTFGVHLRRGGFMGKGKPGRQLGSVLLRCHYSSSHSLPRSFGKNKGEKERSRFEI